MPSRPQWTLRRPRRAHATDPVVPSAGLCIRGARPLRVRRLRRRRGRPRPEHPERVLAAEAEARGPSTADAVDACALIDEAKVRALIGDFERTATPVSPGPTAAAAPGR